MTVTLSTFLIAPIQDFKKTNRRSLLSCGTFVYSTEKREHAIKGSQNTSQSRHNLTKHQIKMKNFRFLLLIVLSILFISSPTLVGADDACATEEGECANPDAPEAVEEDPNCPSRELIIRCAGKHLDANKNGKLDRDELENAIDSLPWYARGILQILGSVDKMVSRENPYQCIGKCILLLLLSFEAPFVLSSHQFCFINDPLSMV